MKRLIRNIMAATDINAPAERYNADQIAKLLYRIPELRSSEIEYSDDDGVICFYINGAAYLL